MPSEDDDFSEDCWITTYSRRQFHLHGSDPDEICLEDIAHATSLICRFTGHVREFYSVAEHMILVANIVKELGGDATDQRVALFHDATEAYLADIAAPFKGELGGYKELEHKVWKRIAAKYGLPMFHNPLIKKADWIALFLEAKALINDDYKIWMGYKEAAADVSRLSREPGLMIWGYSPKVARVQWLRKYRELWNTPRGSIE